MAVSGSAYNSPEHQALRKVIALCGGSANELARRLENVGRHCSERTVQRWLTRDLRVPADYVVDVSSVIGYELTPCQIAPRIFRYADDGLPPELRARSAA